MGVNGCSFSLWRTRISGASLPVQMYQGGFDNFQSFCAQKHVIMCISCFIVSMVRDAYPVSLCRSTPVPMSLCRPRCP